MDRVRAVRFAFRSLEHIEQYAGMDPDELCDDNMSTSVIGIKGAKVLFSPMEAVEKKVRLFPEWHKASLTMWQQETDWHRRRPKNEYWMNLKQIVNILSGRPEQVPNATPDVRDLGGKPKQ
jgi:6-phosphofructokinase 1